MRSRFIGILALLGLSACGGSSLVVPLPQQCERMDRVEVPVFGDAEARELRVERTVNVAEHFPELNDRIQVGAWLSRVQISALDGADLSFVERLSVAVVDANGTEVEGARFVAEAPPGETIHLSPTGADFLSHVQEDGTATVVLRFVGSPPEAAFQVAVTACFAGEAEYSLFGE